MGEPNTNSNRSWEARIAAPIAQVAGVHDPLS